jgi:hypothetical protein
VLFLVVLLIVETRPKPSTAAPAPVAVDAPPAPSVDTAGRVHETPPLALVDTPKSAPVDTAGTVSTGATRLRPRAVSGAKSTGRRTTTARVDRPVPAHIKAIMDAEGVGRAKAYELHRERAQSGT